MSVPVLDLSFVSKAYGGLRPLRIERLTLAHGDQLALVGIDGPGAEVLINLLTGASLPDRGEIRVHGRSTADIADGPAWLASLERFGIVSERAPLVAALSVVQNLALPFSLDVDPLSDAMRRRAAALAIEAGLADADLDRRTGELGPAGRARVRFARALALDPDLLLAEHPTATLSRGDVKGLARDVGALLRGRPATALILTADEAFAEAVVPRVGRLDPASGRIVFRR